MTKGGYSNCLVAMIWAESFSLFIALSTLLGIGTAIVYPTVLAGVSDYTHPEERPQYIRIFRLWRLGYAFDAILTGLIADQYGLVAPVLVIGILTILFALVLQYRMRCESETTSNHSLKLSSTH